MKITSPNRKPERTGVLQSLPRACPQMTFIRSHLLKVQHPNTATLRAKLPTHELFGDVLNHIQAIEASRRQRVLPGLPTSQ
jgi:hypothetical protein